MSNSAIMALERLYQAIESARSDYEFFFGIAQYVQFVRETPTLKEVAATLEKQTLNARKSLIAEAKNTSNTVSSTIKKLSVQARDHHNQAEGLIEEMKRFEEMSKTVDEDEPDTFVLSLEARFRELTESLPEGLTQEASSKVLTRITSFKRGFALFESDRKTSNWGAWERMCFVTKIVYQGEALEQKLRCLRADSAEYGKWMLHKSALSEWRDIQQGAKRSRERQFFFVRDEYIKDPLTAHTFLTSPKKAGTREDLECMPIKNCKYAHGVFEYNLQDGLSGFVKVGRKGSMITKLFDELWKARYEKKETGKTLREGTDHAVVNLAILIGSKNKKSTQTQIDTLHSKFQEARVGISIQTIGSTCRLVMYVC